MKSQVGQNEQALRRSAPLDSDKLPYEVVVPDRNPAHHLSEPELTATSQTADRLVSELRRAIESLPSDVNDASKIARYIKVERTSCQRIYSAVRKRRDGLAAIESLPGINALRNFASACSKRGVDIEGLERAIGAYQHLLRGLAGESRARLISRLQITKHSQHAQTDGPRGGKNGSSTPEVLFECASEMLGCSMETSLQMVVLKAPKTEGEQAEIVRVRGAIGLRQQMGGVPVYFFHISHRHAQTGRPYLPLGGQAPRTTMSEFALAPFSTQPPPFIQSPHDSNPDRLTQIIDANEKGTRQPFDVVLANRSTGEASDFGVNTDDYAEFWASIDYPCRTLLFDVFLDRELARRSHADLDNHLYRVNVLETADSRWMTRMPVRDKLVVLGTGLDKADTPCYPRHRELCEYVFEQAGLDSSQFVGHRCEVAFPTWRTAYRMAFDFST